ncbi:MAG: hypothetical protein V2B18_07660 [Pseudomonadota bacterium]
MRKFISFFFSFVPLTALAASVLTAALTGLWWIVLMGGAAAGIIATLGVLNSVEECSEDRADEGPVVLDAQLQERFDELRKKQREILESLDEFRDNPFLDASMVRERVERLVDGYYEQLMKYARIDKYTDPNATAGVESEIAHLQGKLERTNDPQTRENLTNALRNTMNERDSLLALQRYGARIDSRMANVISSLNSVHLRIVQLGVAPDGDAESQEVNEQIASLIGDVEISEAVALELQRLCRPARMAGATAKGTRNGVPAA